MADLRACIEYRVEKCLAGELRTRVPDRQVYICREVAEKVTLPYIAVQADKAVETFPGNGVYYVDVAILIADLIKETTGADHSQMVHAVRAALEAILPGLDEECGVHIYGLVINDSVQANEGMEAGDLFQLKVGCGLAEKGDGTVLHVPRKTES